MQRMFPRPSLIRAPGALSYGIQWDMVEMGGMLAEIHGWGQAGKGAEIMDEVRLIIIPAIQGYRGPIDGPARPDGLNGRLKAPHPAVKPGGHAHLLAENLNEPA